MSSISNPPTLSIYLRNSQKKAVAVTIPQNPTYSQLKHLACARLSIEDAAARLFFRGELLQEDNKLQLSQKSIIHCVNLANTRHDSLTLTVKLMESPSSKHTFTVTPKDVIKTFADEQLAPHSHKKANEIFLVYASKQLEMDSTFEEQWVENNAQIMCVNIENSQFELQSSTFSKHSYTSKQKDADGKELPDFAPGKGHWEGWDKKPKPKPKPNSGAPNSDTTIPAAPANVITKTNHPKQSNPEDLKSGVLPPPSRGTIGIDSRQEIQAPQQAEDDKERKTDEFKGTPSFYGEDSADLKEDQARQKSVHAQREAEPLQNSNKSAISANKDEIQSDKEYSEVEEAVGKPIIDAVEQQNPVESDKSFSDNEDAIGKPIIDAAEEDNPVESDKSFSENEQAVGKPIIDAVEQDIVEEANDISTRSEPKVVVIPATENPVKSQQHGEQIVNLESATSEEEHGSDKVTDSVHEVTSNKASEIKTEQAHEKGEDAGDVADVASPSPQIIEEQSKEANPPTSPEHEMIQQVNEENDKRGDQKPVEEEKVDTQSPIASIQKLEASQSKESDLLIDNSKEGGELSDIKPEGSEHLLIDNSKQEPLSSDVKPEEPSSNLLIEDSKDQKPEEAHQQSARPAESSSTLLIDNSKQEEGIEETPKFKEQSEPLLIEDSKEEPKSGSALQPKQTSSNLLSPDQSPGKLEEEGAKGEQQPSIAQNQHEVEQIQPETQPQQLERLIEKEEKSKQEAQNAQKSQIEAKIPQEMPVKEAQSTQKQSQQSPNVPSSEQVEAVKVAEQKQVAEEQLDKIEKQQQEVGGQKSVAVEQFKGEATDSLNLINNHPKQEEKLADNTEEPQQNQETVSQNRMEPQREAQDNHTDRSVVENSKEPENQEQKGQKRQEGVPGITEIDNFFSKHAETLEQLAASGHGNANQNTSNLSESFEKIEVPVQGKVEFKAGDLIYSGEMHVNETEHMMRDILAGYAHLMPSQNQTTPDA